MRRPTPWRLLTALTWLLASAACTDANPDFTEIVLDAADAAFEATRADTPVQDAPADSAAPDAPPDAGGPDTPGALGTACTAPGGCQSGFCVDGVCCDSACRERCRSCGLDGSAGTCSLIAAGADPRAECPAQDPATCGRAGGCDGQGDCQLHPAGTECRARSCSAGVEVSAASCNGNGTCNAGTPSACMLAECTGDRCAVGCSSASCPTGFQCQAGKCTGAGPVLHWRFDETSGTATGDSSGNGFIGSYRGEPTLPVPVTSVPRVMFTNPRSLAFAASGRPAVQLPAVTARLRPTTALTISVWFRATAVPSGGADLVNLGNDYILRVKASDIELAKRRSDVEGMFYQLATARNVVGHLDGNWHHLTGVISATSVNLYYDGVLRVSRANGDPILYRGTEFWVGRDGGSNLHDFQGGLDDLRIYDRDLSKPEIDQLAAGAP